MKKTKKKLFVVSNAHLDTQWNWTIQDTIRDCVKNTLEQNFRLFEKYPHYKMNFEGLSDTSSPRNIIRTFTRS